MGKYRVVCITYNGAELSPADLADINTIIVGQAGGYDVKISVLDDKDIHKAVAKYIMPSSPTKVEVVDEHEEAVRQAMIYIGEKFKDCLLDNRSNITFAAKIAKEAAMAHFNGGDTNLLKAIEIIATNESGVDPHVQQKYGFNRTIFGAIRAAYKVSLL